MRGLRRFRRAQPQPAAPPEPPESPELSDVDEFDFTRYDPELVAQTAAYLLAFDVHAYLAGSEVQADEDREAIEPHLGVDTAAP